MSWKTCHGCKGKGFVILKNKDGNEIMNKCIICNGAGMILIEQTDTWTPWKYPDENGAPVYPDVQYGSANDALSWGPCDLYGAKIYVQVN